MKASMKVTGLRFVRTMLRSVGEKVPDTARKQMHRSAERTVTRAQLYVPEDSEALKNSIRIERSYGSRGRLQIDIIVGDLSVVRTEGGKVVNLNQYAAIIHERYRDFKPGEKTKAKRKANPSVYIGERFMTRAIADEEPILERNIVDAVTKVIKQDSRP